MNRGKSGRSPKSIDPKTGISVFSFLTVVLALGWFLIAAEQKPEQAPPARRISSSEILYPRKFEIQLHSADINGKLQHQELIDLGIDRILVRVFEDQPESGGLFFYNSVFRVIDPVFDRLTVEFERNHLDLFAWMIARKFNWVENSYYFDYMVENGNRKPVRKFDIFNPDAVEKIIEVYRELAAKKIQGILIQDDFFIRYNEGFSNWGKAAFTHYTHLLARENLMLDSGTSYGQSWIQVKIDQINRVLSRIVKACKEVNPAIRIGMNVYYETPYFFQKARLWYAHELSDLVKNDIDYIYLMSYHRQIKKELNLSESGNRELFKKILESACRISGPKLIVKLQIRDWDTAALIPVSELKAYLNLIPPEVRRICLTPVKTGDFGYIKEIISSDETRNRERLAASKPE
jgi:biofilm PGA synthesis lipoprotein PgaB